MGPTLRGTRFQWFYLPRGTKDTSGRVLMVVPAVVALHLVDDRTHIGPGASLDELCLVQRSCEGFVVLVVVAVTVLVLVLEYYIGGAEVVEVRLRQELLDASSARISKVRSTKHMHRDAECFFSFFCWALNPESSKLSPSRPLGHVEVTTPLPVHRPLTTRQASS